MQNRDFQSNYKENFLEWWSNITLVRKPILAAVNGYALGGGCEVGSSLARAYSKVEWHGRGYLKVWESKTPKYLLSGMSKLPTSVFC